MELLRDKLEEYRFFMTTGKNEAALMRGCFDFCSTTAGIAKLDSSTQMRSHQTRSHAKSNVSICTRVRHFQYIRNRQMPESPCYIVKKYTSTCDSIVLEVNCLCHVFSYYTDYSLASYHGYP